MLQIPYINLYITSNIFPADAFGISNIQNIFDKEKHEMKLGLQNYGVIMPSENRCIKFNSTK
jgi:hypothetical protein